MFVHNINPTLLSLGPLEIRWYGIIWFLGFYLTYLYLKKRRDEINLNEKQIDDFIFYMMISVLVGARLFHVLFWNPSYYFQNPLQIFALWKGGLAFHGGLLFGVVTSLWFCKKNNISYLKLGDILLIPIALALSFGRLANFINAELIGTVTNVWWCVIFPGVESCRHPVQLYAFAGRFISFLILYKLKKNILWWFLILFGMVRLVVDFWRVDATYIFLTAGQWFSIVMILVGAYFIAKTLKKPTSN